MPTIKAPTEFRLGESVLITFENCNRFVQVEARLQDGSGSQTTQTIYHHGIRTDNGAAEIEIDVPKVLMEDIREDSMVLIVIVGVYPADQPVRLEIPIAK